jgi:ferredoxin
MIDMNVMVAWFLEDESCGRCTTCRGGNQRMLEIFKRVASGQGYESDIPRLQQLGDTMVYSNCQHGQLSPVVLRHTLTHFLDEYNAHAFEHRCPTKVCAELIRYRVVSQSPAVAEAAPICPTEAIVKNGDDWVIDDARCIRCNACKEIAPDDIAVGDRYGEALPMYFQPTANIAPEQVPLQQRP